VWASFTVRDEADYYASARNAGVAHGAAVAALAVLRRQRFAATA
jgi:hypothetical protein